MQRIVNWTMGSKASTGMTGSCWAVVHPKRRFQRLVLGSLYPRSISDPLKLTTHLSLFNTNVHPTSVKTGIPNSKTMDKSGMMCPVSMMGRLGMLTSHMCVDMMCLPSTNTTFNGHIVNWLLCTGVPSIMKICMASESAMASSIEFIIAAYAWLTGWTLGCDGAEATLDVTMVTSSSYERVSRVDVQNCAGYVESPVTYNELHFNAMSDFATPNHHILGNCIFWQWRMEQLHPASMYCWAFCLVKYTSWPALRKWAGHETLVCPLAMSNPQE